MKRLIALFLSALLICTISSPVLAVDTNEGTTVVQFGYTVFDTEGNIKSSGVTPNLSARYSWPGVTLENGEQAIFRKTDGTNFYCVKGTRVEYEITRDRVGYITVKFYNAINNTSIAGIVLDSSDFYGVKNRQSFFIPEKPAIVGSDYYYLAITNASSEPMNITGVSLTF